LLAGYWRTACTILGAFGLAVLATLPWTNSATWTNYLAAGDKFYLLSWNREALPPLPPLDHEGPVEGEEFRIPRWERASSTFSELYRRLRQKFALPLLDLGVASKFLMVSLGIALLGLAFVGRRSRSPHTTLALIVTLSFDTEFFLPQRWAYADVMLLAPVALLLPALFEENRLASTALLIVLLGLVIGLTGSNFIGSYLATVLRPWLVMGAATALVLVQCFNSNSLQRAAYAV
jgi:hypothetical protein